MKDFKEFKEILSEEKIKEIVIVNSKDDKVGTVESILISLSILEEYHNWLKKQLP